MAGRQEGLQRKRTSLKQVCDSVVELLLGRTGNCGKHENKELRIYRNVGESGKSLITTGEKQTIWLRLFAGAAP